METAQCSELFRPMYFCATGCTRGCWKHWPREARREFEIFAARQHFDYTSKPHVKEIALWFAANPVEPFSMHMPLFGDTEMGRGGSPAVNVVHPEKSRRIDAMDEVKRAIESAEEMPLRYMVLHLGEREDLWSPRNPRARHDGHRAPASLFPPARGEATARESSE